MHSSQHKPLLRGRYSVAAFLLLQLLLRLQPSRNSSITRWFIDILQDFVLRKPDIIPHSGLMANQISIPHLAHLFGTMLLFHRIVIRKSFHTFIQKRYNVYIILIGIAFFWTYESILWYRSFLFTYNPNTCNRSQIGS